MSIIYESNTYIAQSEMSYVVRIMLIKMLKKSNRKIRDNFIKTLHLFLLLYDKIRSSHLLEMSRKTIRKKFVLE